MQKTLKLLFLSINRFYENTDSMIKMYIENSDCENLVLKKEDYVTFTKKMNNSKENAKVKIKNIRNYSDNKNIVPLTEADSIVILFYLENYDSLEILRNMLDHLKDNCAWTNSTNKKVYVLGKYQNVCEKHPCLTEEGMMNFLTQSKLNFDYMEVCTKDPLDYVKTVDFLILESLEMKYKSDKHNETIKKDDNSGKCIIF